MKKLVYTLTIVLLALIFCVSAFFVGRYIINSREQAKKNAQLSQLKDSASEPTGTTAPQETGPEATFGAVEMRDENGMLLEYGKVYAENPDLVGWIRIDGTKLDNPVVQTPDNPNFYLDHDFSGQYSEWGAIYAREECDVFKHSDNITLYGHNMRDGSMFACLNDYTEKAVWEQNPLIFFDTLYEYRVYKIFAVFKTTATLDKGFPYHNMIDAQSKEAFDEFIHTCKSLAFYETDITPQYGDKVICLSTCEYTDIYGNGRLVAAAVRIS